MKIKDFVKNDNVAIFDSYRCGIFYYVVRHPDDTLYQFQIPIEDLGNATLKHTEKAITLMRYIRKSMTDNTFVEVKE